MNSLSTKGKWLVSPQMAWFYSIAFVAGMILIGILLS